MVELDQFKVTLNTYREPLQEVQEKKTRGKAKAGQEPDSDAPAEAES